MERTSIELGGVALASTVMNASGPHSAEKDEIHELSARHQRRDRLQVMQYRRPRLARQLEKSWRRAF